MDSIYVQGGGKVPYSVPVSLDTNEDYLYVPRGGKMPYG